MNSELFGRAAKGLRHRAETDNAEADGLIHAQHGHVHNRSTCSAIIALRPFIRIEMDKHCQRPLPP